MPPENTPTDLDAILERAADLARSANLREWLLGLAASEESASSEESKTVELTAKK